MGSWVQGGEHTSKLKMVMTLFFKYLTGNKFVLLDISMIRMCNKILKVVSWPSGLCVGLRSWRSGFDPG